MVTTPKTTIRPMVSGDREQIAELWARSGLGDPASDEWDALADGETTLILVAEEAGAVAGVAVASFDGWRAYIYHVAVEAGRRREGIAHALMKQSEEFLTEAGARYVYVMIPEGNTEGLALAGSSGYLPDGDVVLSKRLAQRVEG
jgi:ribosomal protein S18 acetylase RimI-like enzyme